MSAKSSLASQRRQRRQSGMSLIEIMVGLVIGIIGVLAIFQTVTIWNRHTQSTSAGGDAQAAGTLALFAIERDFRQSGHGFGEAPVPVMGCAVQAFDTTGRGAFQFNLRPVDITVGPGGTPDTINVLFGSSSFFVEGQDFLASTVTAKTLKRRGGFKRGDLVVAADNGAGLPGTSNCNLGEITADNNPDLLTVGHAQANYLPFSGPAVDSRFNAPAGMAFPFVSGRIYNLGPAPQLVSWQVGGANNRTLQRSETIFNPLPALPDQVADGVINMKAELGVDSNGNTIIEPGEWVTVLPAGSTWNQVLAVRVALLVRSRQLERGADPDSGVVRAITTAAPAYFQDSLFPAGKPFVMTNVSGGGDAFIGTPDAPDPNNWRFYRYRVYERVIPLKNMLWAVP